MPKPLSQNRRDEIRAEVWAKAERPNEPAVEGEKKAGICFQPSPPKSANAYYERMAQQCEKKGCEREGKPLRIVNPFHQTDAETPVSLCEEHRKEATERFPNVIGLNEWLKED